MPVIQDYNTSSPCHFFNAAPVRKCLIQFMQRYASTSAGTVTSVGVTMPSAFTVTGSPVTGSGTIAITANGTNLQYIAGNGSLVTFPTVPVAANPSTNIGLVTVNGTATTYMRSDAAPALSQAITPTWTGVHTFNAANTLFGGNVAVAGVLSSSANTSLASTTNSGVTINGGNNFAYVTLFDQQQSANNRTAELIFISGQLQLRFLNDAHSTAVIPLSITGGQASGTTSITSNSGSGVWTHIGNYASTGSITSLPNGGNAVILTGSATAGVPTISTDGGNVNISLQINTKGSGGIILNSSTNINGTATISTLAGTGTRLVTTSATGVLSSQTITAALATILAKGIVTLTADGATSAFPVAHGLGVKPVSVNLLAGNSTASSLNYYNDETATNATNIVISFQTAPPAGSLIFYWQAFAS